MSKRALTVSVLTAGLSAGLLAGAISPAAAQGDAVAGSGNVYFLSGAGNTSGQAQKVMVFGDPGDEVYFGDWDKDGVDSPMVRRGNGFFVADQDGKTVNVFAYGDAGDEVVVGDWDGDGVDSLAVRRGNKFFVKNDNQKSGKADKEFYYGDAGDTVLVGDWNKDGKDTLTVRRGAEYHVKNDTESGKAEYTFVFGEKNDTILVGDWSNAEKMESGNGADQLAVRRGFEYHLSSELGAGPLKTDRVFGYGNHDDNVFVNSLPTPVLDENGKPVINEKRAVTYEADVQATHDKGDPVLGYNANDELVQEKDGFGKGKVYAGGEPKVYFAGDPVVYRGGEVIVDAKGEVQKHEADDTVPLVAEGDYKLNADGSLLREPDNLGVYELVQWTQTEIDALGAADREVQVKAGESKRYRPGQQVQHLAGSPAFYTDAIGPDDNAVGDKVVLHGEDDVVLNPDGTPAKDSNGAYRYYTSAVFHETATYKAGESVLHRKGELVEGFRYDTVGKAWVSAGLIKDDEAEGVYLGKGAADGTNKSKKVADLDADKDVEPVWYQGGEQYVFETAIDVAAHVGGEPVLEHMEGDVKLDEEGNPIIIGDDKPVVITGDGLGVRRNFG